MTIIFACGHRLDVTDDASSRPECPECHETRVVRVLAPPPRFTGAVRGPLAVKE